MIGVDYDLFWTLNPKSLTPFVKAFSLKQEYDDAMHWEAGVYIRAAVASVLNKSSRYPLQPYSKTAKEAGNMELLKERFLRQAARINANFRKEENTD